MEGLGLTKWVLHFLMMMRPPRLSIHLGLIMVEALLAAGTSVSVVLPLQVKDALDGVQKAYDVLNERWLEAQLAKEGQARLKTLYQRAQVVIQALNVHLQTMVNLKLGENSELAQRVWDTLLPERLAVLKLTAPELFSKLRSYVYNTERHFEADLARLGASPHVNELKKAMTEFGDLYRLYGPHPREDQETLGALYLVMMNAVRIYFVQVVAWAIGNPVHMSVAEDLLAPAGQWTEERKEQAKNKKSDNDNPASGNGAANDGSNPPTGNTGAPAGDADADQGTTPDCGPMPAPVASNQTEVVANAPVANDTTPTSETNKKVDRVTVAVPLEVRTSRFGGNA